MDEITLGLLDHLLIFILGIIFPFFAAFQAQPQLKDIEFDTSTKLQVYYQNSLVQWVSVGFILAAWYHYGRSFTDIGLGQPTFSTTVLVLIIIFIIWYLLDVWWELRNEAAVQNTRQNWIENIPFLPETWYEYRHFLFVAVTAGVCEEIIFRGFFIQYFLSWNIDNDLGTWLSIAIPAFLFSIGHLYQGFKAVLKTLFMAILLGWIFIKSGSLWVPIVLHFLIDAIGGYLGMKILK